MCASSAEPRTDQRHEGSGVAPASRVTGEARVTLANAGDHWSVHRFLLAACQQPSADEFQASVDDPFYEPADRLLIKRGGQIVAHLQIVRRVMLFGQATIPFARLEWLTTLPEYAECGFQQRLLREAEQRMRDDGTVLATAHTAGRRHFHSLGWVPKPGPPAQSVSIARLRAALAGLTAGPSAFSTRLLRQIELDSLMKLYGKASRGRYGPSERTDAYWRWLLARGAHSDVLVAIQGPDSLEFVSAAPQIAGYAVIRRGELIELAAENSVAAQHLVARVCRDAVERDLHRLLVHPGLTDGLMRLARRRHDADGDAGHSSDGDSSDGKADDGGADDVLPAGEIGSITMLKVMDREAFCRHLFPELIRRAGAAGIKLPVELRLLVGGKPWRFTLSRRSASLQPGTVSARSDLVCSPAALMRIMLGLSDPAANGHDCKIRSKRGRNLLRGIFPPLRFEIPLWDRLPA